MLLWLNVDAVAIINSTWRVILSSPTLYELSSKNRMVNALEQSVTNENSQLNWNARASITSQRNNIAEVTCIGDTGSYLDSIQILILTFITVVAIVRGITTGAIKSTQTLGALLSRFTAHSVFWAFLYICVIWKKENVQVRIFHLCAAIINWVTLIFKWGID